MLSRLVRQRSFLGTTTAAAVVVGTAAAVEFHADYQEEQQPYTANQDSSTGKSSRLPRSYDRDAIRTYWKKRPLSVVFRVGEIGYELGPTLVQASYWRYQYQQQEQEEQDQEQDKEQQEQREAEHQVRLQHLAIGLREAVTNLGPAFVKAGQQLATRPDLIPAVVLKELQTLCDAVRPIPDDIALAMIRTELNNAQRWQAHAQQSQQQQQKNNTTKPDIDSDSDIDIDDIFEDIHLVASASIGQVYKAKLKKTSEPSISTIGSNSYTTTNASATDEYVAIKVQRPGMEKVFSLDLFLLQLWGDIMDAFTTLCTEQIPYHSKFFDAFSSGSYQELDYEKEAANQLYFKQELGKRMGTSKQSNVYVPNVYPHYTTQRILTTEWIEGIKLADASPEIIRRLIPIGVELFLTQLLDLGRFHCDPHPGNLLVTTATQTNGTPIHTLCLIDYGLCATVTRHEREAITKAIVHLLYRDYATLIHHDTKELGFLPHEFDTTVIEPILTNVLTGGLFQSGSDLSKRKQKLGEISNELNAIFFHYPFQVPGFFALLTRGLGLLEGIALQGDPDFDIFRASAPYATRRAVTLLGREYHQRRRGHEASTRSTATTVLDTTTTKLDLD